MSGDGGEREETFAYPLLRWMKNRRLSRSEYVVLLGTEMCQCEPFGWSFLESTLDLKLVLNPNLLGLLKEDYPPGKRGSRRWPLKRLKSA